MHVKGLIRMAFLLSKLGFWGLIGSVIASGAIVFGTINVVGGYLVTDRMLKMFKKKGNK